MGLEMRVEVSLVGCPYPDSTDRQQWLLSPAGMQGSRSGGGTVQVPSPHRAGLSRDEKTFTETHSGQVTATHTGTLQINPGKE